MKLLVRNLVRSVTESELIEMFEAYGKVQSCALVIDPKTSRSKGFGFIEMPNPGEAKAAAKSLNGRDVLGLPLRVKKVDEPAEKEDEKPEKKDKYRDKAQEAKKTKPMPRRAAPSSPSPSQDKTPAPKEPVVAVAPAPAPAVADDSDDDKAEAKPQASVWANAKPKKSDDE